MKKILCIDYHFPPLMGALVGGFKMIRFLPDFGWKPYVISAAETVNYPKDYSLLKLLDPRIEVFRVAHKEHSREWQYLRQQLKISFDFPDSIKSWKEPAIKKARDILKSEKFDVIYSSSPSYTTAWIALQLKKEFKLPWIAEILDAWTINDYLLGSLQKNLLPPLKAILLSRIKNAEKQILKTADRIITIHPYLKNYLPKVHHFDENKIEVVTDGYCETDFQDIKPLSLYPGKLTIAFMGGSYWGFKEIALKFLRIINELCPTVEIVVIGRTADTLSGINMPNLTLIYNLPQEKAYNFVSGADLLLLITLPTAKWHTPSKLYHYLRLGKPILALVPPDGDAAKIIMDAKAGHILSYNENEMRSQLKKILNSLNEAPQNQFEYNSEYIKQFERNNLNQKIIKIFNDLLAVKNYI